MIRPIPAALVLGLALGACSQGSTDTPATPPPAPASEPAAAASGDASPAAVDAAGVDTCALLSGVDLDAALGEAAATPRAHGNNCDVKPADVASPASMLVQYVPRNGAATYAQQNALFGVDAKVQTLGNEAVASGNRIHARAGDAFLLVQVVRNPVGAARQISPEDVADISRRIAANAGW